MKAIKISLYIVLQAGVLLLGTGCWDKMEPKELGVIHSIIYDIKDDGQIKIIAEVMDPSAAGSGGMGDGGGGEQSITVVAEGQSAREALSHLSFSLEKHIFAPHNKVRFFTERFAKKDIASILDFLIRDHFTD